MIDFEDDFADQDLSKLTKAKQEYIKAIDKVIAENFDPRTKTVGDRVAVWDTSRLTDIDTGKYVTDSFIERFLADHESIVIADNVRHVADLHTLAGDFSKVLDLKIWNKDLNKVFLTSSDFVKLIG
jgi:hypothetical protein